MNQAEEILSRYLKKTQMKARDYGRAVAWSGPVYRSMSLEGSAIRIYFDPVVGGLAALPPGVEPPFQNHEGKTQSVVCSSLESRLEGFSICGVDQKWVLADARMEGDSVVVWSAEVPAPVAVRYAWGGTIRRAILATPQGCRHRHSERTISPRSPRMSDMAFPSIH